jgi:hypothetical protein
MPRRTLYKSPHPQTEPWPPEAPRPGLLSDEPAREVYKAACAAIGQALEPLGFRYIKSKQRCVAKGSRFTKEIAFQSSHHNVSGRHVQLWMYAAIDSHELQAWRAARFPQEPASAYVAGGMVHLLGTRFAFVEWELADPRDREETIQDAIAFIHSDVLPYFEKFDVVDALLAELARSEVPGFFLMPSVEFSYCFGGPAQAQATLDRFLRVRPDLHAAIAAEQASPSVATLTRPGDYVSQVVFMRHHFNLR